jgi:hypothetical protein
MKDVYLQFWRKEGDWLIGGEENIWVGTIPNGGSSEPVQIIISSDINEPYEPNKVAWLYYRVLITNGEVSPQWVTFEVILLEGPGPANLLSATPLSSREINLTWEVTGNRGCCAGYYAAYRPEGQADFILNPQLIVGATDYTLEMPYPSTEYELRMVTANYDGEPTELVSNSLFATTHPYLSSRTQDALDPSNGSKFLEKGDKVYLVHEDQDKVWLITGKKDPGKGIAWDQREYLLSDLLPRAWDPCIGLLETTLPWDTMLFCAFAGRDGVYEKDKIYAVWLDPDNLPNAIIAPQAIYEADFGVNLFNLDVALNYQGTTPTAHLVWEEHREQGNHFVFAVKYGLCNLNNLKLETVEMIDGEWTMSDNGGLPFASPDVELGDIPWVAFLKEGWGAMVWNRYKNWTKVYYSTNFPELSFSGNMKDYMGLDFGIAPPSSPAWPFLAFAYRGEQVYLASYNGASWDHSDPTGIVGASTVSDPAVSWSHDTAFVTWKGLPDGDAGQPVRVDGDEGESRDNKRHGSRPPRPLR